MNLIFFVIISIIIVNMYNLPRIFPTRVKVLKYRIDFSIFIQLLKYR